MKKFKAGDTVRCLMNSAAGSFTKGKFYKVVNVEYHTLRLINNSGINDGWDSDFFELVEESKPTQSDLKRGYWTTSNYSTAASTAESKPETGGIKYDSDKPDLTMIPYEALEQVAKVLGFGAQKYGRGQWKEGIKTTRLAAAALRHLGKWCDGIDLDDESNMNHIAHAATNLLFLLWTLNNKPELDNRDS